VTLPRSLPERRRPEPYSRADAPYFRSPGFFIRVGGLGALVLVALGLLALRAWSVQILHGPQYTAAASSQAWRAVDLIGPRGAIVDAHGRKLATTTGRVVVAADVDALGAIDRTGWHASARGLVALRRFSALSHTPVRTLVLRIERSVTQSPFAPAVVLAHPEAALASYLAERAASYPGFKIEAVPSRHYPQGALGSEFLGLLGQVDPRMLKLPRYAHAKPGEIVGVSGVEATYDRLLNGGFDRRRVRVDSMGRVVGPLEGGRAKPLPTLRLTIDTRLQRAAEKAIRDGMQDAIAAGNHPTGGSAVAMNPYTGAILALASSPNYNQVAAESDPRYNARLYTDPRNLLLNRAIAGVYPTGSTFKPIIAEAALAAGVITPSTSLLCSGSFDLGGTVFHNVEAGVFESMTLPTALSQSCDTWFYRLGDLIWNRDPARQGTLIQQWARRFGLGRSTGVDLTGDNPGLLPTPGKAFLRANGFPWTEGQTINLSIGQGELLASPLQMAVVYSALVNGGTIVRPHVAGAVIRGASVKALRFKPLRHLHLVDTWAIREGLVEAAHTGTSGMVFGTFPVPVAGKTGTAESGPGRDDHSWYASFAPANHPKIVVVTMIEHGGFGAQAAAPAAKEIYEAYFHVRPNPSGG
jgi:penicillin-binding protein 2